MDGIIYGSIVGLGMAVTESVYYMSLTAWPPPPEGPFIPPTEIVRLCGHLVMGGITGFAVGMMRMEMKRWFAVLLGCVSISMTMHFLWDWIAFDAAMRGAMLSWQTIIAAAMMLFGMVFYGVLVVIGSDWSRREFAPHSARSLWKWPFTLLVRRDFSEASRSTTHQDRDSTP